MRTRVLVPALLYGSIAIATTATGYGLSYVLLDRGDGKHGVYDERFGGRFDAIARVYRHPWQVVVFQPAACLERIMFPGRLVTLGSSEDQPGDHDLDELHELDRRRSPTENR